MLVSGIKSRPVYRGLKPDLNGRRHLIIIEGEGALAAADLVALSAGDFRSRATILYVACGSAGQAPVEMLRSLGTDAFHLFPTIQTLAFRLSGVLSTSTMGTRLYISGTEGFIGQMVQLALAHHIDHHSIATEHRGSLARRVQCVHCKGITEEVTTNVVPCAHCGLNLLVRDHYSRRLGAFMGVSVDAEEPGKLPLVQEIYR